jgi:predicted metal-dependent HD superfamily phosphohydrolase
VRRELAARFAALVRACGGDPARAPARWRALAAAHAEPHRVYHDLRHVAHVLVELDRAGVDDPAAAWAAFFHDAVYRPGRRDNEARSARLARELAALGRG